MEKLFHCFCASLVLMTCLLSTSCDGPIPEPDLVKVVGVSLNKSSVVLTEGEEISLTATINPGAATNKNISWTSSDNSVATVYDGKVLAVNAGEATISVITEDGGKTASCTVKVLAKIVPVAGVSLDRASVELTEGAETTLVATVTPSDATNQKVTWKSSDSSVASVSEGKVTAHKVGTADITVTTEDGEKTATCVVTVVSETISVTGVSLDRTSVELVEGSETTLVATVTPSDATNKKVIWKSSDSSVASVSEGRVLAHKAGAAIISVVTEDGGKTATCVVTVVARTIPVTDVKLDRTSVELVEGGETTLVATVTPSDATNKKVTWKSSDSSVASVSEGKVTAHKVGTADITVTTEDGEKTATCVVTVVSETISVTGVSLDRTSVELVEGGETTLVATVTPSDATNKKVTWKSSDSSVASVSEGRVLAHKAGSATISVITEDGNKMASCAVKVIAKTIPVTDVKLDRTSVELVEGGETTLVATVTPSDATNKKVIWKSSNGFVASVSDGTVLAHKAGSTIISVVTEDGSKSATCVVTVVAKTIPVTGVSLDRTTVELTEGDETVLVAAVTPSDATNKKVIWKSSNGFVASVSEGRVLAHKAGSTIISVITEDGDKSATCVVTVVAKTIPVTDVKLDRTSVELVEGGETTLVATVTPSDATNQKVTWKSSDSSVASVSEGRVLAHKAGSAIISVVTEDGGKTATCVVTVVAKTIPVTDVKLDRTSVDLVEGSETTLVATVIPSDATNQKVTWKSSDSSVASVSEGRVLAHKAGSATISVITEDGNKMASCAVKVIAKTIPVTDVKLDRTSVDLVEGSETTLVATVTPSDATNKKVIWKSSDSSVASVSEGRVLAHNAGSAIISVVTEDGGKTATCVVTVVAKTIPVTDVKLDRTSVDLVEGSETTLVATVTPSDATNQHVTWKSSDSSVASVSEGRVLAHKAGAAIISVVTEDGGKTATCVVTVVARTIPVTDVKLDRTSVELVEGGETTLVATVTPSDATNQKVTWMSSDSSVASVSEGRVLAHKAGAAIISVVTEDGGKTATCVVTVVAKTIPVTGISLDKNSLKLAKGDEITLTAICTPENATDKTVTWSSSNINVATVSNGKVKAVGIGKATVMVQSINGLKATCSVEVIEKPTPGGSEGTGEIEW